MCPKCGGAGLEFKTSSLGRSETAASGKQNASGGGFDPASAKHSGWPNQRHNGGNGSAGAMGLGSQ